MIKIFDHDDLLKIFDHIQKNLLSIWSAHGYLIKNGYNHSLFWSDHHFLIILILIKNFDQNQGKMSTIFTYAHQNAWYEKGKKIKILLLRTISTQIRRISIISVNRSVEHDLSDWLLHVNAFFNSWIFEFWEKLSEFFEF